MSASNIYSIARNMSHEERMNKCRELTEWSKKFNQRWKEELEERMKTGYTLR
ncbi:MAG: hypothetical protein P1P82_03440 [Bacteroidales bacterium]|nr:hypothetical protein [Bacteroidales bacterium]MDT8431981.1 hypothetical protein [Bacteroidales bacterium]